MLNYSGFPPEELFVSFDPNPLKKGYIKKNPRCMDPVGRWAGSTLAETLP